MYNFVILVLQVQMGGKNKTKFLYNLCDYFILSFLNFPRPFVIYWL